MGGLKDLLNSEMPFNVEVDYQKTILKKVDKILELKETAQNRTDSKTAFLELKHAVHSLTMLMLCSRKFYDYNSSKRKKEYDSKPVKDLIKRAGEVEKLDEIEDLLTDVFEKLAAANIFMRYSDDDVSQYFERKR